MTMPRFGAKRDTAEAAIVDALRKMGCSVYRLDKPVDLLIGYRGRTFVAECKTGKKKFNAAQKEFAENWRGGDVAKLATVDDALQFAAYMATKARAA